MSWNSNSRRVSASDYFGGKVGWYSKPTPYMDDPQIINRIIRNPVAQALYDKVLRYANNIHYESCNLPIAGMKLGLLEVTDSEIVNGLDALRDCGLINWDRDSQIIRIVPFVPQP